ncbi:MAG: MBL fold metallo-hydrolase [Phycisphaerae bacterium]|nr:MAG: MBL fold metallo-hydrolase [Phycisphaerae bacterium]
MRFLFLGTGTSAGVPAIGCACEVCTSADPRDRRLRTSAAVRFTDTTGQARVVLLDAGPDLRQQALRAGLTRCDAILFTHNHVDHTFGLDEVRRFNAVQRTPIDILADAHTMAHLRRVYTHIFEREKNVNDSFVASLVPRTLDEQAIASGRSIDLWGLRVTPFRLLHGKLPVLGYRLDVDEGLRTRLPASGADLFPLAYCTDMSGVPNESWKHLFGLRTLVLDALRHRQHPTHLTLNQAVHLAGELDPGATYFVHMAHDLPHEATQAELPARMFLAWDGLELGG